MQGCDVNIVQAATGGSADGHIVFTGNRFYLDGASGAASDAAAGNEGRVQTVYAASGSCAEDPRLRCKDQCLVTVTMPQDTVYEYR